MSIYDLKGLGLTEYRNGWVGSTPVFRPVDQVAVGLVVGLFVAWLMGRRFWSRIAGQASRLRRVFRTRRRAAGPAGRGRPVFGSAAVAARLADPLLVVSALAVPVLVFPGRAASTLRHLTRHVTARGLLVTGALMVPLAAIIGFAVYDAAAVDIVEVRNILDDPQSVHAPPDVQPN